MPEPSRFHAHNRVDLGIVALFAIEHLAAEGRLADLIQRSANRVFDGETEEPAQTIGANKTAAAENFLKLCADLVARRPDRVASHVNSVACHRPPRPLGSRGHKLSTSSERVRATKSLR